MYEPNSRTVLYSKNENEKRAIASTTKILTAVVVLEKADPDTIIRVPASCVGVEGTSMYLKENEQITIRDLLYGLLLQSDNDAAEVLAHHVGKGNLENFVALMNKTAQKIGMINSHFKNPHGLPDEEHYSTAYDMALLAAYALENPTFSEIAATKNKTVAGRALSNHNKLLRLYNGATGVKTGYTKSAGRCLVSSAKRNGTELVAITLSASDDWNDHIKMLNYGFENYEMIFSSEKDFLCTTIPVVGGCEKDIPILYSEDIAFLRKKSDTAKIKIYAPRFLYAPVRYGDEVGYVNFYINGELEKSVALLAGENVMFEEKEPFLKKFFAFFRRI